MGLISDTIGSLSGADQMRSAAGNIQFQPRDVQGLLGGTTFDNQGNVNVTGSDQLQGAVSGLFGGGQALMQQGQQAATQDFSGLRDDSLATLREMARPAEEQAAASTASRLANQGTLGATGGVLQMQALEEQQQQADLERIMQSIGLAQKQQQQGLQQMQEGSGLFGQAAQIGQVPLNTANLGLQTGQGFMDSASQRAGLQAKAGRAQGDFLSGLIGGGAQVAGAGMMGGN